MLLRGHLINANGDQILWCAINLCGQVDDSLLASVDFANDFLRLSVHVAQQRPLADQGILDFANELDPLRAGTRLEIAERTDGFLARDFLRA
jgi:hypothetical protein